MFSMDWDAVVIPIILIGLYFLGYFLYLGLRRYRSYLVHFPITFGLASYGFAFPSKITTELDAVDTNRQKLA